jgi:hypothetical protein
VPRHWALSGTLESWRGALEEGIRGVGERAMPLREM